MIFSSIKTKLTCAVFVLIVIIMTATTIATLFFFEEKFRENISRDQFALLNAVANQMDEHIVTALVNLDTAADSLTPAIVANHARAERFLAEHSNLLHFYDNSLFLFSRSGRLIAAHPREMNFIGKDFSFRDYFGDTVLSGKICISAPLNSVQKQSNPIVMFTAPVYGSKGEIIAVLGGAVGLKQQHYLRSLSSVKLGRNGFLSLYDSNRTVLMHPDSTRLLQTDPPDRETLVERALQGFAGTAETVTHDGVPVLRSVKRLDSSDWVLAISYPLADAYGSIHAARKYFLAGSLAAALLSVLVVWPLMRYLTKPLLAFTRHLETLPSLDDAGRLFQSHCRDEIGILVRAFNYMILELGRRKAELKAQKEFAERLVQHSSLPTFVIDAEHKLLIWNKACEELTGVKSADIIGSDNHWTAFFDQKTPLLADLLIDGDDHQLPLERMVCSRSKLIADGWRCEGWYEQLNGTKRYVILDAAPIRGEGGEIVAVIETVQDMTDLKLAEQAVRESEERYRQLFENNPHPMWAYDLENLAFLAVNNAAVAHYGYSRDEFLAMTIKDIRPPEDIPPLLANIARVSDGMDHAGVWRHIRKDGSVILVEITSHTMQFGERRAEIVLAHDVTERMRAEEALVKLSTAIEQSPVSVVITDATGIIEYANMMNERIYGFRRGEGLGSRAIILDRHSCEEAELICPVISAGNTWRGTFRNRKKSGETFWEQATVSPVKNGEIVTHFIIIEEDITERKSLEEQLRQSQKMEAIGTLVGGIAHDFNNMLTAIIGYSTMAQLRLDASTPGYEYLNNVLAAGERAAQLSKSLLAYSRKQVSNPVTADLNDIVGNAESLLRRLVPENIEFTLSLAATPLTVKADAGQIDQILMNLVANARDAMSGSGRLKLSTEVTALHDADAASFGRELSDNYALLAIADTGVGMDETVRERIFEPFFTTKEVGKGTGLGLSMVYGLVKQHNGFITCHSEPGRGTVFKIYLPLIDEEKQQAAPTGDTVLPRGDETVLLVEDDENVRLLLTQLLEASGYRVIVAGDGQDAVARFAEHKSVVKLVILDVIMPKMGGKDVSDTIFELSLDARILFISGYTADIVPQDLLINERCAFLSKPIAPGEFLHSVREILDTP